MLLPPSSPLDAATAVKAKGWVVKKQLNHIAVLHDPKTDFKFLIIAITFMLQTVLGILLSTTLSDNIFTSIKQ